MAKDSFLMYTEWSHQVKRLSDDQAGILLKAIFAYNNGEQLPPMDDKTDMCFSFIQGQLDRDSKKYDDVCEKRRASGKKGGVANATKRKQMLPNATFGKQSVANQADNDNEYDNENDYEYDDDSKKSKDSKCFLLSMVPCGELYTLVPSRTLRIYPHQFPCALVCMLLYRLATSLTDRKFLPTLA